MPTLEQAAKIARSRKSLSYKDQIDFDTRLKLLQDVQRKQYKEHKPRQKPKKGGLFDWF